MKKCLILSSIISMFCIVTGCFTSHIPEVPAQNEIVMKKGMKISATNNYGTMTITAGKGMQRSFTWAGGTRTIIMMPRKERWYGRFGIMNPGYEKWEEHDGMTRPVVEEGQLHFNSEEKMLSFIASYSDKDSIVYNDNGLFIAWVKSSGGGGTLSVQLWQFYIQGKKPVKIPGSKNERIKVEDK